MAWSDTLNCQVMLALITEDKRNDAVGFLVFLEVPEPLIYNQLEILLCFGFDDTQQATKPRISQLQISGSLCCCTKSSCWPVH